jgi:CRISPR-associated protein (TIGR03986 family)
MSDPNTDVMGLPAPYNFVPLAREVCTDWGVEPSQDIPFSDGLSGSLSLTIAAHAPLLVSGSNEGQEKQFYRLPDGTPAIPGTSLRGMIRNVVEIISFGKFRLVDDRRFGLRDLTPAARLDYGSRFTATEPGTRTYTALSKAGWLSFVPAKGWQIAPCDFARIDHSQFQYIRPAFHAALAKIKDNPKQDARRADRLYEAWDLAVGAAQPAPGSKKPAMKPMPFMVQPDPTPHRHSPGQLVYREAFAPGREPPNLTTIARDGIPVFTGLPSRRKHLEFVFLEGGQEPAKSVPAKVWRGFLDVHERQEKPSETWKFWFGRYQRGETDRIPVFYLEKDRCIAALGLAMMFKLAQDRTTHDMIRTTGPGHVPAETEASQGRPATAPTADRPDLAERLFGRIDTQGSESLKGRVSFSVARLQGSPPDAQCHTTILGAPKPSYFPAYVRQVDFADGSGAKLASVPDGRDRVRLAQYRTYMEWNGPRDELRGWKRYPARGPVTKAPPKPNDAQQENEKLPVKLRPLSRPDGLRFAATLRFHNLRPCELGALAWALDWDGRPERRHALGMGKPFGWGQVTIRIDSVSLADSQQDANDALNAARTAFVDRMNAWVKQHRIAETWAATPQMRRLTAMADPANTAHNAELRYMTLDPEKGAAGNEFLDAKKQGLVLREYWDATDQRAFEGWRRALDGRPGGKAPQPPVPIPPLTTMKGLGRDTQSTAASPAAGPPPPPSAGRLFRRGDRVRNIAEQELAEVAADQRNSGDRVRIRYIDGTEEAVDPGLLSPR